LLSTGFFAETYSQKGIRDGEEEALHNPAGNARHANSL